MSYATRVRDGGRQNHQRLSPAGAVCDPCCWACLEFRLQWRGRSASLLLCPRDPTVPASWTGFGCVPAISTGVYRFPAARAARIAVSATIEALRSAPVVNKVIFCCFSDRSARLHADALAEFGEPCSD